MVKAVYCSLIDLRDNLGGSKGNTTKQLPKIEVPHKFQSQYILLKFFNRTI